MAKPIKMGRIIEQFRESWLTLTDVRKGNNSQKYTMTDGALAAFSVFFMQSSSFLAFQREHGAEEAKQQCKNAVQNGANSKRPTDSELAGPRIADGNPFRLLVGCR